MFHSEEVLLIR